MHQINLLNNVKMKKNQNKNNNMDIYENQMNKKTMHTNKTIIFVAIGIIIGLAFLAAVILISIEFHQMYRLSHEATALTLSTSNSSLLSTIMHATHATNSHSTNSSTIMPHTTSMTTTTTVTSPTTTTTTQNLLLNTTQTPIIIGHLPSSPK